MTNLFEDRPIVVLPKMACAIGMNESIFLMMFREEVVFHGTVIDDNHWIKRSLLDWRDIMPWWSMAMIRRTIDSLEQQNILQSSIKFNDDPADRTKWYSFTNYAKTTLGVWST